MSENWDFDGPYRQEQSRFNWRWSLGTEVPPTVTRDPDFLRIDFCTGCNRKVYRLGGKRLESPRWPCNLHKCNRPGAPERLFEITLWEPKTEEVRLGRVALHQKDLWGNILVLQASPFDGHCLELEGSAKLSGGDLVIFRLGNYGRIAFLANRGGQRISVKQARLEPAVLGLQENWGAKTAEEYRFGELPPNYHQCPYCESVYHVNFLAEHILAKHRLDEQQETVSLKSPEYVRCRHCKELVEKERLISHLKEQHPKLRRKPGR